MPVDPVAAQFPRRTRIRVWVKRVASWQRWALLGAMLAVVALALGLVANARANAANARALGAAKVAAAEAKARTQQLQDAFCGKGSIPGLLPTILKAKLPSSTSQLGRNIVIGAHFAAQTVHCPGVR